MGDRTPSCASPLALAHGTVRPFMSRNLYVHSSLAIILSVAVPSTSSAVHCLWSSTASFNSGYFKQKPRLLEAWLSQHKVWNRVSGRPIFKPVCLQTQVHVLLRFVLNGKHRSRKFLQKYARFGRRRLCPRCIGSVEGVNGTCFRH